MVSFFQCEGTGQRLSILDYDDSRTNNVRYRAVINDDQVAVLHLQSVDIKDTPVSQLSLCPGVREADMSEIISQSASSVCALFLIEKAEEEIVYRSRDCRLLQTGDQPESLCGSCEHLISRLGGKEEEGEVEWEEDISLKLEPEPKPEVDEVTKFVSSNVAVSPVVISILRSNTETGEESVPVKRKYKKMKTKVRCPDCPDMFVSQLRLRRHAKIVHCLDLPVPVEKEPINCPFCEEKFPNYSSKIPFHLKCFHLNEKENPLYVEMMERVEAETRMHLCSICGKDFLSAGCLERHMSHYHQQGNLVSCDQCGKGYKDQARLTNHINRKHAGPYQFKREHLCVECGKVLSSKVNLDNHIYRFHSDNAIKCQECEREFRHPYDLVRHIGQVHTAKEKTERCTQCDKMFYNSKALQLHVRSIHEKLKPWYCEFCPFKCSRLSNLNDHRRKSHNKMNLSRMTLLDLVEHDQHPSYNKDDLPMLQTLIG